MKVIDEGSYNGRSVTVEDAIGNLLTGYSERGTIEQIDADVECIKSVLTRFIASSIRGVDQLNVLAGYERFKGDK